MVPTAVVILTANAALNRAGQGAVGAGVTTSATLGGPACFRAAMRGCGMYLKISDITKSSHHPSDQGFGAGGAGVLARSRKHWLATLAAAQVSTTLHDDGANRAPLEVVVT